MNDSALYEKVARKTLTETLYLRKGETVTVETWGNGLPLAKKFVLEARRLGAIPVLLLEDEPTYVESLRVMPKDSLGMMGRHEYGLLAGTDAYVFIPGPPIGAYAPSLDRQTVSDSTRYNSSWYEAAKKARLRGARFPLGYIGKDYAGLLHKRPEEMAKNQLRAALVDLRAVGERAREVARKLQDGTVAFLKTDGGRAEVTLRGELEIEDGIIGSDDIDQGNNMTYIPPGFVSKEVEAGSATGTIKLSPTITRLGRVTGATLEFKEGKLVGWGSKVSARVLDELVGALKPENRTLSFMTVGINTSMKYDNGQDRMVAGSIGIGGFGFSGIIRNGTLSIGGKPMVHAGKLMA